jgi:hypothetical protein
MNEYKLTGNEFCDFKEVNPSSGMPSISNLRFFEIKTDFNSLTGNGIYTYYYDSMLLYVGIYVGKSTVIKQRWLNHIGLLTGRAKGIWFNKKNLNKIKKMEDCEYKRLILQSKEEVLFKERGLNYHFHKFKFSAEKWDDFKNLDVETLKRFSFCYIQYNRSDFDTTNHNAIKKIVEKVEKNIITKLQPRCNGEEIEDFINHRNKGMEESMKVVREEMKKAIKF